MTTKKTAQKLSEEQVGILNFLRDNALLPLSLEDSFEITDDDRADGYETVAEKLADIIATWEDNYVVIREGGKEIHVFMNEQGMEDFVHDAVADIDEEGLRSMIKYMASPREVVETHWNWKLREHDNGYITSEATTASKKTSKLDNKKAESEHWRNSMKTNAKTVKKTASLYSNQYFSFSEERMGSHNDLKIEATDEGVQELNAMYGVRGVSPDDVFHDVIEDAIGNGFALIAPEEIGALTDAPKLGWDVGYADDGQIELHEGSKVWWYPNYQVTDPMKELMDDREVLFQDAGYGEQTEQTEQVEASKKTAAGTGLGEYRRGDVLTDIGMVQPGQLLAYDSMLFKATNLVKITQSFDDKFYAVFVNPENAAEKSKAADEEFVVYPQDLEKGEYYIALEPAPQTTVPEAGDADTGEPAPEPEVVPEVPEVAPEVEEVAETVEETAPAPEETPEEKPVGASKKTAKWSQTQMEEHLAEKNAEDGTEFELQGAYGNYELWAKGDRIEAGSLEDVYQAWIKNRLKEKYRKESAKKTADDLGTKESFYSIWDRESKEWYAPIDAPSKEATMKEWIDHRIEGGAVTDADAPEYEKMSEADWLGELALLGYDLVEHEVPISNTEIFDEDQPPTAIPGKQQVIEASKKTAESKTINTEGGDMIHIGDRGERGYQVTYEIGSGKNTGQVMDVAMGVDEETAKQIAQDVKSVTYELQYRKGADKWDSIHDALRKMREGLQASKKIAMGEEPACAMEVSPTSPQVAEYSTTFQRYVEQNPTLNDETPSGRVSSKEKTAMEEQYELVGFETAEANEIAQDLVDSGEIESEEVVSINDDEMIAYYGGKPIAESPNKDWDELAGAIQKWMDEGGFFPNIVSFDDHGGITPQTIRKKSAIDNYDAEPLPLDTGDSTVVGSKETFAGALLANIAEIEKKASAPGGEGDDGSAYSLLTEDRNFTGVDETEASIVVDEYITGKAASMSGLGDFMGFIGDAYGVPKEASKDFEQAWHNNDKIALAKAIQKHATRDDFEN